MKSRHLLWSIVLLAGAALARDGVELLDESEYRSPLEEVIVRGEKPRWDDQPARRPDIDPRDIEFESSDEPRLNWLPRYTADERDNYDGVRDRKNEKPLIKLFEFKF
ncbi:MAG TPA: hypothetical protein VL027_09735 [Spongiibacteraceae bacterium]|jgi:hypothetical protein|nr:hypothetical protein [Spongiibacteraceae bacterium]HUH38210.1 hypothetical protein [Spongiibacteraceae bacterium]